jgi:hypothetical protein
VVGYAMGDNYQTPLIVEANRRAAQNITLPTGAGAPGSLG